MHFTVLALSVWALINVQELPASSDFRLRQATGIVHVVNDFVVEIEVADRGTGYVSTPGVRIEDSGGSGGIARAVVQNGSVIGIEISNPGSGYTTAARVFIDPPTFGENAFGCETPSVTIEGRTFSAVFLRRKIWEDLGFSYGFETSPDLREWTMAVPGQTVESIEAVWVSNFKSPDSWEYHRGFRCVLGGWQE